MKGKDRALVAVVEPVLYRRLEELLEIAGAEISQALDRETALALGSRKSFSLILSDLPLRGAVLCDLLARIAGSGTMSANCPVLLFGRFGRGPAAFYEGAGEIRSFEQSVDLLRAVAKHLGLGDRIDARLLVQMDLVIDSEPVRRAVQTANVSTTGMLLRSQRLLPVGEVVPFSLDLPYDPEPLAGQLEVVRHSDPEVEGVHGMGVRFVDLLSDAGSRIEGFVQLTRQPGGF